MGLLFGVMVASFNPLLGPMVALLVAQSDTGKGFEFDPTWFLNFGTLGLWMLALIFDQMFTKGSMRRARESQAKAWALLEQERQDRRAERETLQGQVNAARADTAKATDSIMGEVVPLLTRTLDTNRAVLDALTKRA